MLCQDIVNCYKISLCYCFIIGKDIIIKSSFWYCDNTTKDNFLRFLKANAESQTLLKRYIHSMHKTG